MAAQSTYISPLDVVRLYNPLTTTASDLEDAYRQGNLISSKVPKLSLSVLLNGVTHYVRHQWASALISIWTSVEQLVTHLWENHIVHPLRPEISGRRDFLEDFRTWITAAKIEVLFQRDVINDRRYNLLNSARKSRNEFVHRGVVPTFEAAASALEAFFELLVLCANDAVDNEYPNYCLELINRHKRGDVFAPPTKQPLKNVSHWMPIMPVPGNLQWGNKEYERIPEITLHRIEANRA
jgi:hypothetical protein